jgi:hypothetical protein
MLINGSVEVAETSLERSNVALTQLGGGGVGDRGRPARHATLIC